MSSKKYASAPTLQGSSPSIQGGDDDDDGEFVGGAGLNNDDAQKPQAHSSKAAGDENDSDDDNKEEEPLQTASKKDIALMIFINFLSFVCFAIVLPSLWPFLKSFGENKSMVGWAVAVNSAGTFLASPVLGKWADKRGVKEAIFVSLVVMAGGNIMYSLSYLGNFWMLLAARFIVGCAAANYAPASAYLAYATSEKQRTMVMTINSAAGILGFILGPAIATALAELSFTVWKFKFNDLTSPGYASVVLSLICLVFLPTFQNIPARKVKQSNKQLPQETEEEEQQQQPQYPNNEINNHKNKQKNVAFAVDDYDHHYPINDIDGGTMANGSGGGPHTHNPHGHGSRSGGRKQTNRHDYNTNIRPRDYDYEAYDPEGGYDSTPLIAPVSEQQLLNEKGEPLTEGDAAKSQPKLRPNIIAAPDAGSIRSIKKLADSDQPLPYASIFVCLLLQFIFYTAFTVFETIGTAYTETAYGWSVFYNGLLFAGIGGLCVVSMVLLQLFSICLRDRGLLLLTEFTMLAGFGVLISYPLDATVELPRFIVGVSFASIGFSAACAILISIFSKLLENVEQGLMMGWLSTSGSAARVVGPIFASYVLDYVGGSLVFMITEGSLVVALLATFVFWTKLKTKGKVEFDEEQAAEERRRKFKRERRKLLAEQRRAKKEAKRGGGGEHTDLLV